MAIKILPLTFKRKFHLVRSKGNTTLSFKNATDFGNWLYDTLKVNYKQNSTLSKYGNANNKTSWVNSYVERINNQIAGGKIIAGGDILISAKDINVNGLIQSGCTKYIGEVDTSKVNKLSGKNLSDDDVFGNTTYLVTKNYNKADANDINSINGVVKNGDGYYDKQIELYYNPSTGNILANDIYSKGGNVTLKGNILSTGGGKIVVSNGAAYVSVTNESDKKLKLGAIESTESKGMVTIIYKVQNNKETTFSSDSTYSPVKNMNYKWTGGGNYTLNIKHKYNIVIGGLSVGSTINATGDIKGETSNLINFGTLNLNSSKGKMDYFKMNGGAAKTALNATEAKDIYIECFGANDNEDLRIGTIESKAGNVTIATKGNLVSAVTERQNPTNATQIENWKNAGIFNTWSQKELVNALNGNIFSKDPYTVDFALTANIIANRVILDVGGNIGSTATAKTINYSNLNSEENLKLLANVRVRDLEQGSNSVTYTPHTPIGLTLRGLSNSNWNLDLKGTADDNINLAMADNKTFFYIKSKGGSSFYTIGNENADVTFIAAAGITSSVNTRIYAKNLTLSGGKGKDTIVSTGDSGIYKTGVGNDFINASGNFVTIDGGVVNDIININGDNNYLYLNSSKNSTIDTGAVNDYIGIDIENSNSLLIEVGSGGNDEIGGFSVSDTIKMAAAVKRSYVDGNDFVIEFNKGSVRVKDLCFSSIQAVIAQGELVTLNTQPEGLNIANKKNTSSIAGNAGADTITNSGNNFTITSGNGNDSVTNSGSNSQVITGRGNHTITNSGANTLTEGDNTSTVSYEFNGKVTNDLSGNSFKLAKGTAGEIMLNDYDFNVTALNSSGGKFISDNDGVTFMPDSGKMNI